MTLDQIYDFLEKYYGYKASLLLQWNGKKEIDFILYDSFSITCGFDEYGAFKARINLPDNFTTSYFVAFSCFLVENNEKDISCVLKKIDEYCRLLLPDKFLKVYDKIYKRKGHYIFPGKNRR